MSISDTEAVSNNSVKELGQLIADSSPTNKITCHYVSLPTVILKRVDEEIPSLTSDIKSPAKKLPKKKPTKTTLLSKRSRRNSPRSKKLPEKRPIKLTNKGDILHIVSMKGSNRKFIEERKGLGVNNGAMAKQNVVKNSGILHKPLLKVQNKMEGNKMKISDSKLPNKTMVQTVKKGEAHSNKKLQDDVRGVINQPLVQMRKGDILGKKSFQGKAQRVITHPLAMKHNINARKVTLPTQNRTATLSKINRKELVSNSAVLHTQQTVPFKRKLLEEDNENSKLPKMQQSFVEGGAQNLNSKLLKTQQSIGEGNTQNTTIKNVSNLVNNTKVPPDKKTAKVIPLAKARKTITLPKPETMEMKSSGQEVRKNETPEPACLLSKLVGIPIAADKVEVLPLQREDENRKVGNPKASSVPSNKRQSMPNVTNLSKLLSDSLKPGTSEMRHAAVTTTAKATVKTTEIITTAATTMKTTPVTTTTDVIVQSLTSDLTSVKLPTSAPQPVCTKELPSSAHRISTKKSVLPSAVAVSSKNTSPSPTKNSVQEVLTSDGATHQISSQNLSATNDAKTIYDVMADVSVMYPAWNLHILEDTNTFCIAYVGRSNSGVPAVVKCIELDEQFNAKVYVHQYHCKRFDGQYNDEESIVSLVTQVNSLKA